MSEARPKKRPSPEKTEQMDEKEMKKALMMETGEDKQLQSKISELGEVLPTLGNGKEPISNEGLGMLFKALCGDTCKTYDSDDSIISDIDGWDAETIAEKDKKFQEVYESVSWMKEENKLTKDICNIGKETKEQKEKRRKWMRERQQGLTTDEEKAEAERKRKKEKKRQEKRLANRVQVFSENKESKIPYITCSTMSSFLEALAEVIPEAEGTEKNHKEQIENVDSKEFAKRVKSYYGIKCYFYKGKSETGEIFVLRMVNRILTDEDILDVFNSERYGFDFTTKECVLALENYYSLNKPSSDSGRSIDPLSIEIRELVKSAFQVARNGNPNIELNKTLKEVLFD